MASFTFTVEDLLRSYWLKSYQQGINNFYDFPAPDQLITETKDYFFNFDMLKYWHVFDNYAENKEALNQFQKAFLLKYFEYESQFETPAYFKTRLMSWWMTNAPLYSILLKKMQTDIFVTTDMSGGGNTLGTSSNHDKSHDTDHAWGTTDTLTGTADTPQNDLNMNVEDLGYASTVGHTKVYSDNMDVRDHEGQSMGKTTNSSTDHQKGRNSDIFDQINKWTSESYTIYLDMFDKLENELFSKVYGY